MGKLNKFLPKSPQEETRKFALGLMRKTISKEKVMEVTGVSERTFYRYKNLIEKRKTYKRKVGSGRQPKLTKQVKLQIQNKLRVNPFQSVRDLAAQFDDISSSTIHDYLIKAGFHNRRPRTHLTLSDQDKQTRLLFANSLRDFQFPDFIIFIDEATVWLHDNDLPGWFHGDAQNPLSVERHGSKLQVCGGISCMGKIFIETYHGNMNSSIYSNMFQEYVLPAANATYPYGWWLAQDNSPSHKGDSTPIINRRVMDHLNWPPRSPDIMPIENLWNILKKGVRKRQPSTLHELDRAIFEEWNNIPNQVVESICESFPNRIEMLIESEGDKIRY